jgi:cyclic pyranopterin monophosphate synthase
MPNQNLSHLDQSGHAHMVDITQKSPTLRRATAEGYVLMSPATLTALTQNTAPKGEVLSVARIAAIQAAKKTADLIPLCHTLPLEQITIDFEIDAPLPQSSVLSPQSFRAVRILATASITAKTGIEMEALTAASIAALTIIDMLKALDPSMIITNIRLLEKTGGKSHYQAPPLP